MAEYGFAKIKKKLAIFLDFLLLYPPIFVILKVQLFFINVKHCTFQIERSIFRTRNVNAYES